MNRFSEKYNGLFLAGLLLVLLTFFYVRPLNSPWHPFIAGDGLGYYAYLPAKFIHNDPQLDFKWFNRVYNQNYVYSAFPNPEDNLLVQYGDKKINKYYQGLSYIWMPFFIMAHVVAKLFHYTPDGFSAPYQLFMGLASLFYLFIGLIFLRKLLWRLFHHAFAAATVPFLIFFGTHLFTYAVKANTLSHAYSFTFTVLFLYYSLVFFEDSGGRLRHLFQAILFLSILVCIRPLNALVVFTLPALLPKGFRAQNLVFEKWTWSHLCILLLSGGAVVYQLWLTHIQTGSFLAYTYTDERFDVFHSKCFEALCSYHMGLFVYVPLIFVSLFGLPFLKRRMGLILSIFFFGILFLYSAWWYWPITKRAMVDFYALPAIFIAALISHKKKRSADLVLTFVFLISVAYFQFKDYQIRSGILDEYTTYKEVFWRNFFRTTKSNQFLVPPESILKTEKFEIDFEDPAFKGNRSLLLKNSGQTSLLLDSANYICTIAEHPFPALLEQSGGRKIRFSFHCYAEKGLNMIHVFMQFRDHEGKVLLQVPFYVGSEYILFESWDRKEFGYEISDPKTLNMGNVDTIEFIIWNVEGSKRLFIDDARIEFILTDSSFETVK